MKNNNQPIVTSIVRNQARIIGLLHWNLAMYSAFMYNAGLVYLENYMGKDEEAINKLTPREMFWNWWKALWNARDEAFIEEWEMQQDNHSIEYLRTKYRDIHNPAVLASDTAIPSSVYPKDFATIKTELV